MLFCRKIRRRFAYRLLDTARLNSREWYMTVLDAAVDYNEMGGDLQPFSPAANDINAHFIDYRWHDGATAEYFTGNISVSTREYRVCMCIYASISGN